MLGSGGGFILFDGLVPTRLLAVGVTLNAVPGTSFADIALLNKKRQAPE